MNWLTSLFRRLCGTNEIIQLLRNIMATQAQLATDLAAVLVQLKKASAEIVGVQTATDVLTAKIAELEAIIAADGEASAELTEAVAAVKAQAQVVDEQIPDLPVVPPAL